MEKLTISLIPLNLEILCIHYLEIQCHLETMKNWPSEYDTHRCIPNEHALRCLAELAFSTKSSMESDVYSYGVVLLELLTRRAAVDPSFPDGTDIVSWASSALNGTDKIEAVCDPALMEEVFGTVEMEEVSKVLSVALRCAAREASQRPSMTAVVKELTDARPATGGGRSLSKSKQGKPGSQSNSSAYRQ
jgi:serine/threonine protein kinase